MPNNPRRNQMTNNHPNQSRGIIDSTSPTIVIQETPISLSDEKLKRILSQTYEAAVKNTSASKYYKHYDVLMTIALTLVLPLITSKFNSIGMVSAETITVILWVICLGCFVVGFVFLMIASNQKMKSDTEERDGTIDRIFKCNFTEE
ncbi:MAG: hypothetical protein IKE04_01025 [Oscillospiraceae bacterium]|nr:hypothetical protein [Oscillospiraceae bacterium]MBR6953485.1 hypothetical protein [Clostridia bacterium]